MAHKRYPPSPFSSTGLDLPFVSPWRFPALDFDLRDAPRVLSPERRATTRDRRALLVLIPERKNAILRAMLSFVSPSRCSPRGLVNLCTAWLMATRPNTQTEASLGMPARGKGTTPCGTEGLHAGKGTMRTAGFAASLLKLGSLGVVLSASLLASCGEDEVRDDGDAIVVGSILPFTGKDATIAQNLEQAMLLAVDDVNRAGGVGGRKLALRVRDSNSGSNRGLHGLLSLLYGDHLRYIVGPEEHDLANEIVPDLKGLDVLNVLPGYASPRIERVGRNGAWLRLAPSPLALGCSFSELARRQHIDRANAVVVRDEFYQAVASEFLTEFNDVGGQLTTSATIAPGRSDYRQITDQTLGDGAQRTLLFADPTTASTIVTNWAVGPQPGGWILGPTLNTPGFLPNIPLKSLDGVFGISPTLSLKSECESLPVKYQGPIECGSENAKAFSQHFKERWDGDEPFPAAHFYYDAIVLIAMGLTYELAEGNANPTAYQVREAIRELSNEPEQRGGWDELDVVFATLVQGAPIALRGAAAEYEFDGYGAARHTVMDTWSVKGLDYVDEGKLQTRCVADDGRR